MKRYFNTSGPNIPEQHYTLFREKLIDRGVESIEKSRYVRATISKNAHY